MDEIVRVCMSPLSKSIIGICDFEKSKDKLDRSCCSQCFSKYYLDVEQLEKWVEMLLKEGVNSKHLVREEMKKILRKVKNKEEKE